VNDIMRTTLSSSCKGGTMSDAKKDGMSDNAIAAIAYFTPVMAFFFLAIKRYNKRPYVRFHAWQSLLFNIFAICLGYVMANVLPFFKFVGPRVLMILVCLAALLAFLIWVWCVIRALHGDRFKLPIIGDWADEQAYR
jgi:uncharacterized membrane protein